MAEENILKVLSESFKIQLMSQMSKPRDLTSEQELLPKFLSFYKVTLLAGFIKTASSAWSAKGM